MEENHLESKIEAEEILKNFSSIKKLMKKFISSKNLALISISFFPVLSFVQIEALKLKLTSRFCTFGVFSQIRVKHLSSEEVNIIVWKEKLDEKLIIFLPYLGTFMR